MTAFRFPAAAAADENWLAIPLGCSEGGGSGSWPLKAALASAPATVVDPSQEAAGSGMLAVLTCTWVADATADWWFTAAVWPGEAAVVRAILFACEMCDTRLWSSRVDPREEPLGDDRSEVRLSRRLWLSVSCWDDKWSGIAGSGGVWEDDMSRSDKLDDLGWLAGWPAWFSGDVIDELRLWLEEAVDDFEATLAYSAGEALALVLMFALSTFWYVCWKDWPPVIPRECWLSWKAGKMELSDSCVGKSAWRNSCSCCNCCIWCCCSFLMWSCCCNSLNCCCWWMWCCCCCSCLCCSCCKCCICCCSCSCCCGCCLSVKTTRLLTGEGFMISLSKLTFLSSKFVVVCCWLLPFLSPASLESDSRLKFRSPLSDLGRGGKPWIAAAIKLIFSANFVTSG